VADKIFTIEDIDAAREGGAEILFDKKVVAVDGFCELVDQFKAMIQQQAGMKVEHHSEMMSTLSQLTNTIKNFKQQDLAPVLNKLAEIQIQIMQSMNRPTSLTSHATAGET